MELSISNLSKTYANGVVAVDDVSLDIPTGLFGLLGPNGAGKSTLMRTIATLQEADSGKITFEGINVLKQKSEVKKVLGYLPQNFGFYPKDTAYNMLNHFALLKGVRGRKERQAKVEELLKRVNLWNERKQKLGTYSNGMRQRFGIALALLGNPRLIMVDEPTEGLAPILVKEVRDMLEDINKTGVSILFVEHNLKVAMSLADRIYLMGKAQLAFTGTVEELEAQPEIREKYLEV